MGSRVAIIALVLLVVVGPLACIGSGLLTDGTSVSIGHHSRGLLRGGNRLPFVGEGYRMPQRWKARGRNHGTDELVDLLVQTARRVRQRTRGGILGVADLSPLGGGSTPEHRSHHSGRDVDLLLYAADLRGKPIIPQEMIHFDAQGNSVPPKQPASGSAPAQSQRGTAPASAPASQPAYVPQVLDLARNWALVRELITHPRIHVQWIFLGRPLITLLLDYAERKKEPRWLIDRAATVLHQPGDAQNHMDHFHVRIFCEPGDRRLGCVDRGPPRWKKKTIKYRAFLPIPASLPGLDKLDRLPLRFRL